MTFKERKDFLKKSISYDITLIQNTLSTYIYIIQNADKKNICSLDLQRTINFNCVCYRYWNSYKFFFISLMEFFVQFTEEFKEIDKKIILRVILGCFCFKNLPYCPSLIFHHNKLLSNTEYYSYCWIFDIKIVYFSGLISFFVENVPFSLLKYFPPRALISI